MKTEPVISHRVLLHPEELRTFLHTALLLSGVDNDGAAATANGLWHASMRGVDSHGARLLPHYIAGIKGGRIECCPEMKYSRTAPACGILDAAHGLGHGAGVRAMKEAIALAGVEGAGFVSVRNSSHCGELAFFAEMACEHDMIGLAFTHATPKVRTYGSNRPFFGINPLCLAAPMDGEGPFCYDSAPTLFSNNKIKQYAEDELPLPTGVAADSKGIETIDPLLASMVLPIGGYKGVGLAAIVEILCGFLSGMPAGPDVSAMYGNSLSQKRFLAQFYGAIQINSFQDVVIFKKRLAEMAARLRAQPRTSDGLGPMLPGDPEKKTFKYRMNRGIPVTYGDLEKFRVIAESDKIKLPAIMEQT